MKKYKIKDDIYNCDLNIVIGTRKESEQFFKQYYNVEVDLNVGGKFFKLERDGAKKFYIWIGEFKWTIDHQRIMVHEILHYVFSALQSAGLTFSESSEEAYTYYYDYIFAKIWHKLKPKKKSRQIKQ